MKNFEPSGDFVSRVMGQVRAYEAGKNPNDFRSQRHFSSRWIPYALSAGGLALGFINFFRIYSAVLAPVACK